MTPATPDDLPEVEAFLAARAHLAMFPLTNLRNHGLGGDHPNGCRYWLTRDGAVTDVLALSNAGMVMPVAPLAGHAAVLDGLTITGAIGPRAAVRALAIPGPRRLDSDEPHFLLDLDDLRLPPGPGQIVPLGAAPQGVMETWLAAYCIEALNMDPAEAAKDANRRLQANAQTHVCLMEGGKPLAMSGFNASLPEIVQVGGVYTPPDLRGEGHARRCIGLHLVQAQKRGVRRATLFAASAPAARAYKGLGFDQVGDWSLILLQDKEVMHG